MGNIFVDLGVQVPHSFKELKGRGKKKKKNVRKNRFLKFVQIQIEPEPLDLQKCYLHFWNCAPRR